MGKQNRQRRADKHRARQRAEARARPTGSGQSHPRQPPPIELIRAGLIRAAELHCASTPGAAARHAGTLSQDEPRLVDGAIMELNQQALQAGFERGWLPDDVCQLAHRQVGAAAATYVVDLVAEHAARYPAASTHHRWLEQVRDLDATMWWPAGSTHLREFSLRHNHDRIAALTVAIEVLALLISLPGLPRVLPLPGTVHNATAARTHPVDEKVLARVRALLAKAESTTFPDEAEALSAKAQELMTRHAFDHALLDSTRDDQPVTARRIWLDNPYANAKVLLVQSVAGANRCRTMYYGTLGFVAVLGDEVDLKIVEVLTTSLLVQATKAMLAKGSQISHSGQSRTRSYRQAFLVAYAGRIGERLRGVSEATISVESERDRLLPVLAARRQAVDELFDTMFPRSVARQVSVTNSAGWAAGRAAADLAHLHSRQRIGNATSQTSSAGFAAMKSVK